MLASYIPLIYTYNLDVKIEANIENSNALNISGSINELTDYWGRQLSGSITINDCNIRLSFSFPLYLKVTPSEQCLVRFIFNKPEIKFDSLIVKEEYNPEKFLNEEIKISKKETIKDNTLKFLKRWSYREEEFTFGDAKFLVQSRRLTIALNSNLCVPIIGSKFGNSFVERFFCDYFKEI